MFQRHNGLLRLASKNKETSIKWLIWNFVSRLLLSAQEGMIDLEIGARHDFLVTAARGKTNCDNPARIGNFLKSRLNTSWHALYHSPVCLITDIAVSSILYATYCIWEIEKYNSQVTEWKQCYDLLSMKDSYKLVGRNHAKDLYIQESQCKYSASNVLDDSKVVDVVHRDSRCLAMLCTMMPEFKHKCKRQLKWTSKILLGHCPVVATTQ